MSKNQSKINEQSSNFNSSKLVLWDIILRMNHLFPKQVSRKTQSLSLNLECDCSGLAALWYCSEDLQAGSCSRQPPVPGCEHQFQLWFVNASSLVGRNGFIWPVRSFHPTDLDQWQKKIWFAGIVDPTTPYSMFVQHIYWAAPVAGIVLWIRFFF